MKVWGIQERFRWVDWSPRSRALAAVNRQALSNLNEAFMNQAVPDYVSTVFGASPVLFEARLNSTTISPKSLGTLRICSSHVKGVNVKGLDEWLKENKSFSRLPAV